jgi:bifunctional DNA-binding transcriptional regulator/antitoxin component of YhaV-PrlF toxin-antitoxin module
MSVVVEADEKGRILLPAEMRRRTGSKRFKLIAVKDHLELHPLPSAQSVKGKYRSVIKSEWEELEEKGEEFVTKRKR